jgi:hypothetical protein
MPTENLFSGRAVLRPLSRARNASANGLDIEDIKKTLYLIAGALSARARKKIS